MSNNLWKVCAVNSCWAESPGLQVQQPAFQLGAAPLLPWPGKVNSDATATGATGSFPSFHRWTQMQDPAGLCVPLLRKR